MPDGTQASLPGIYWPEAARRQHGKPAGGGGMPLVALVVSDKDTTNPFYDRWHDKLGACHRPFGRQDFALCVGNQMLAAATSCSTVSRPITRTLHRRNVVELARIARHDDHPHVTRALLRLWRLYLAPYWSDYQWPIDAVISYQMPGTSGDIYRFDGWTRIRPCAKSGGGGTYSNPSKTNRIADGIKYLWGYSLSGIALDDPDPARKPSRRPPDASDAAAEVDESTAAESQFSLL